MPESLAPDVIEIQEVAVVALHPQPAGAVTLTVPEPPEAVNVCDVLSSVATHGKPASFTVNVLPAIDRLPDRALLVELPAALKLTVPDPVPVEPAVTAIQLLLLVALQSQPAPAVTVTLPVPPDAATDCDVGEIE